MNTAGFDPVTEGAVPSSSANTYNFYSHCARSPTSVHGLVYARAGPVRANEVRSTSTQKREKEI